MNNAINEIMEKMKKINDELVKTDIKKILENNEKCVKCDLILKFSAIADDILKQEDNRDEYAGKIVDLLFELVFMGEVQKATMKATMKKIKKRKITLDDLRKEIEKSFMKKTKKYEPKNCTCDICKPKNTCDSEEEDYDYIE
jgi:hypothetical protein